ncbi:MAG: GGDEF domain-containing protein [Candidatus Latescibacterota bacterium]|nr:MAG: GGDEF domain-containing protein [Candidatus Latescibacterota bacterium]
MRTFDKDYEYLLGNLVPQHRLSADRRRQINDAIANGDLPTIRLVSILALEDLCETEYFDRKRSHDENGHVVLTYVRNNGSYQIRLILDSEEWRDLRRSPPVAERKTTAAVEAPPIPETPLQIDTTINILPDLIRSFSIDDHRESTLHRLDSVLRLMPSWFRFAWGRLILVEGRLEDREARGEFVVTKPEREMLENAIYQGCRRGGETTVLDLGAARAAGVGVPESHAFESAGEEDVRLAVTPIFTLGDFWGILEVWVTEKENGSLLDARVDIASGLIEQIIENAVRLENLTSIDKLTQIYNRTFYDKQVRIEMERATRSGTKLSLLVLDIDDFKMINDTMGHRKGDEALALVADLIKGNLRKIDIPFRYGGEEFVILLPGTAEMEAIHTAERLRVVIGEFDQFSDEQGTAHGITVSIGAAVFPDHARTEEELFARADAALYMAKRKGKNRVEFYRQ